MLVKITHHMQIYIVVLADLANIVLTMLFVYLYSKMSVIEKLLKFGVI